VLRLFTVLAVVAAAAWTAPVAGASDSIDPPGRMMLVLDSSGSMAEETPDGPKRIDAAKDALRRVIDELPEKQEVGLRVYGAEVFDQSESGACTDSQLIVEPGADNRDQLTDGLKDYKPYGETPIGYALQEAGKDLGAEGQRTIVLLSDGEPTCDPDPCEVAADLSGDGIDVRIDVVGLNVSGEARDKLKCVADKGHGTYYDADNADDLTRSLDTSATRASRPFDLTGEAVEGAAEPSGAPTIEAPGQYLDTFPDQKADLWYRIERTTPGSTIHVGAAHRSPAIGNFGTKVDVAVYADPEKSYCGQAASFARGSLGYAGASTARPQNEACQDSDVMYVRLGQMGNAEKLAGTPVEIAVYEEPPLKGGVESETRDEPQKPEWKPLNPDKAVSDVVPGTSVSNAPVVKDGSYELDVNPGETQSVAVPLDWGQDLQAQIDATVTRQGLTDDAQPRIQVTGPLRQEVGGDYTDRKLSDDWTTMSDLPTKEPGHYRWGRQAFTVDYDHRFEVEDWWVGSSLPGLRYVLISLPEDAAASVPYTLTVKTDGGADGPAYADAGGLTPPAADSALVSDGTVIAAEERERRNERSSDGADPPWLPIGLGAAGVAALAAAILLFKRGRKS